jgi:hypothetical protein
VHGFIRMNLVRPRTNQASIQLAPIFISSHSSLFFLILIDLLRLIFIFGITVDQCFGGCLILIDGCDFEYNIFHLDFTLSIYDDLLSLLLKFFFFPDVILIEFFSLHECDYLEYHWIKFFVFTYLVDSLKYFDSHVIPPISHENQVGQDDADKEEPTHTVDVHVVI